MEGPDWDTIKEVDPELAGEAFEQMRAVIRCLVPFICSTSDRLWLTRVAEEEILTIPHR